MKLALAATLCILLSSPLNCSHKKLPPKVNFSDLNGDQGIEWYKKDLEQLTVRQAAKKAAKDLRELQLKNKTGRTSPTKKKKANLTF